MVVGERDKRTETLVFSNNVVDYEVVIGGADMAELTLTMKVKINPTVEQSEALALLGKNFTLCCNDISKWVFENKTLSQKTINAGVYHEMREKYGLLAQITQSAIRRVVASYRTVHATQKKWSIKPTFSSEGVDLLWNRDYTYSKKADLFSLPVMKGRTKVRPSWKGTPAKYREGKFGTARLLHRNGKWALHIPVTIEVPDPETPERIVGVDMGINFLATSDDGRKTNFYPGREVKQKRGHFKQLRSDLQKKGTRSARKRLKAIGSRENRYMKDVNHCVSKALVTQSDTPTLFVLEDLSGIRNATEKVRKKDRYVQVSWAFYQLRQMIEYKAKLNGHQTIAVDPAYTSQTCPICGHVARNNRNKKLHTFQCKNCGYQSNDDRVAAMNLRNIGFELMKEQSLASMTDKGGVLSTTP